MSAAAAQAAGGAAGRGAAAARAAVGGGGAPGGGADGAARGAAAGASAVGGAGGGGGTAVRHSTSWRPSFCASSISSDPAGADHRLFGVVALQRDGCSRPLRRDRRPDSGCAPARTAPRPCSAPSDRPRAARSTAIAAAHLILGDQILGAHHPRRFGRLAASAAPRSPPAPGSGPTTTPLPAASRTTPPLRYQTTEFFMLPRSLNHGATAC